MVTQAEQVLAYEDQNVEIELAAMVETESNATIDDEAADISTPQAITATEAETVEVDTFGNDVEHVKMVEEPPDPGIQLITDPHQDGDMTTAELAGEQVPVLQQPPPEAGGEYCHGPHQAVANTDVE